MMMLLFCLLVSNLIQTNRIWCQSSNSYLDSNQHPYQLFSRRQKRYLLFEKGAALVVQTNIGKSLISEIPRGLNEIAEYTLHYDLPSQVILETRRPAVMGKPYSQVCYNYQFQEYFADFGKCKRYKDHMVLVKKRKLKRSQHFSLQQIEFDSIAQRLLYDLVEQWSLVYDLQIEYCFQRTLCESDHMLLPENTSLLHAILRILLSYTRPWAKRYKTFQSSLQTANIQECLQHFAIQCPQSWLHYITTLLHSNNNNNNNNNNNHNSNNFKI